MEDRRDSELDLQLVGYVRALCKPLQFVAREDFAHLGRVKGLEEAVTATLERMMTQPFAPSQVVHLREMRDGFLTFARLSSKEQKELVLRSLERLKALEQVLSTPRPSDVRPGGMADGGQRLAPTGEGTAPRAEPAPEPARPAPEARAPDKERSPQHESRRSKDAEKQKGAHSDAGGSEGARSTRGDHRRDDKSTARKALPQADESERADGARRVRPAAEGAPQVAADEAALVFRERSDQDPDWGRPRASRILRSKSIQYLYDLPTASFTEEGAESDEERNGARRQERNGAQGRSGRAEAEWSQRDRNRRRRPRPGQDRLRPAPQGEVAAPALEDELEESNGDVDGTSDESETPLLPFELTGEELASPSEDVGDVSAIFGATEGASSRHETTEPGADRSPSVLAEREADASTDADEAQATPPSLAVHPVVPDLDVALDESGRLADTSEAQDDDVFLASDGFEGMENETTSDLVTSAISDSTWDNLDDPTEESVLEPNPYARFETVGGIYDHLETPAIRDVEESSEREDGNVEDMMPIVPPELDLPDVAVDELEASGEDLSSREEEGATLSGGTSGALRDDAGQVDEDSSGQVEPYLDTLLDGDESADDYVEEDMEEDEDGELEVSADELDDEPVPSSISPTDLDLEETPSLRAMISDDEGAAEAEQDGSPLEPLPDTAGADMDLEADGEADVDADADLDAGDDAPSASPSKDPREAEDGRGSRGRRRRRKRRGVQEPVKEQQQEKAAPPPASVRLSTPVAQLKGVGPRLGALLERAGLGTVEHAVRFLPSSYQDRRRIWRSSELLEGELCIVMGVVTKVELHLEERGRRLLVMVRDEDGELALLWPSVRSNYLRNRFREGARVLAWGTVAVQGGVKAIVDPDTELIGAGEDDVAMAGRIIPLYAPIEGVGQRTFRRIIAQSLELVEGILPDPIPQSVRERQGLKALYQALHDIHFPPMDVDFKLLSERNTLECRTLAFQELFVLEYALARSRKILANEPGTARRLVHTTLSRLLRRLPPLNDEQAQVLETIKADLSAPHPMLRVLQSDVHCGRNELEALTIALVLDNDAQVAVLAPGEAQAEQHASMLTSFFGPMGIEVETLAGANRGRPRERITHSLRRGEVRIIVGTHANFQENLPFRRLGLVIFDQGHRLAPVPKRLFRGRGAPPDVLVLTSSPYPQALRATLLGDVPWSFLRTPSKDVQTVTTEIVMAENRERIEGQVRRALSSGAQLLFAVPVATDNEKAMVQTIVSEASRLRDEVFPGIPVGFLHPRMHPMEQRALLSRFASRDLRILVFPAEPDLRFVFPHSSLMIIDRADELELSRVHTLRAALGRSRTPASCFLVPSAQAGAEALARLELLTGEEDGFALADRDLMCGQWNTLPGVRDAGLHRLAMADLVAQAGLLADARREAFRYVDGSADSKEQATQQVLLSLAKSCWPALLAG